MKDWLTDSKFQPGEAPAPLGLQGDVIISPTPFARIAFRRARPHAQVAGADAFSRLIARETEIHYRVRGQTDQLTARV
jgi:hypothetical protein